MAGRRLKKSGSRYRTAAQRQALKKAQLASARKRKRNRRIAVGVGAVALGAAGVAARPRLKAKAAAYPYAKMAPKYTSLQSEFKIDGDIRRAAERQEKKRVNGLLQRAALISRNKARRLTPEQRADSKKRRADYLASYNRRRKEQYRVTQSVGHGVRSRKPRAKETKPRKRKTD